MEISKSLLYSLVILLAALEALAIGKTILYKVNKKIYASK
jgi:hypothetical protein